MKMLFKVQILMFLESNICSSLDRNLKNVFAENLIDLGSIFIHYSYPELESYQK